MIIDEKAREKLFQRQQTNRLTQAVKESSPLPPDYRSISDPLMEVKSGVNGQLVLSRSLLETLKKLNTDLNKFIQVVSSKDLEKLPDLIRSTGLPEVSLKVEQLNQVLDSIKGINIPELPKEMGVPQIGEVVREIKKLSLSLKELKPVEKAVTKVAGVVEVANFPVPVKPASIDFAPLLKTIQALKTEFPSKFLIGNAVEIKNWQELIDGIEELKKGFNLLINQEKRGTANGNPMEVRVANFPPQLVPQPVTHISVNSLRGFVKTRAVTVTSALTPLPGEVLSNRRSIIIYNNSSQTVEVGGSTFTFGEGLPVPANSYSPIIDAGSTMIVYGRVTSGSADARVLEVSDEDAGR